MMGRTQLLSGAVHSSCWIYWDRMCSAIRSLLEFSSSSLGPIRKKRILGYPSKVKFQHLFLKTGSAQLYLLRKDVPVHWLVCRAVPENVPSLRRQSRWHYYVECLVRRMSCIIYGKKPAEWNAVPDTIKLGRTCKRFGEIAFSRELGLWNCWFWYNRFVTLADSSSAKRHSRDMHVLPV